MSLIPSFLERRSTAFNPFSVDLWDPFCEMRVGFGEETSQFAWTRVDWKEMAEAHVFKADVPGLKKEEVKVEVEKGNVLQISDERSREKKEKNDTWHRVQRSFDKFLRRFCLSENALDLGAEEPQLDLGAEELLQPCASA